MSGLTVLVTGGAGFIGSRLVQRLVAEGHFAVVIDNLTTGHRENVPSGVPFIEGDIGREETVAALPNRKFDVVCHLAAQSSGAVSMEQPIYDIKTNAVSTLLLVRWCQRNGVQRFLYASSMAVYGNAAQSPVTEEALAAPISYYGVSKLTSEGILAVAARTGLSATAFRMFNVYGPGQNMANLRQGMASIYLAYLLRGVEVPVTGSLERFRDFVYIEDVLDAWMNGICRPTTPSLVYNLGFGGPTTVRELLADLIVACGLSAEHPIKVLAAPPGDQFGLYADCERAAKELGWRARTPRITGLRRMVEWAKREMGAQLANRT